MDQIRSRMRDIETMAKEVGGYPGQSTTYMGYSVMSSNLEKVMSILEGTYTYDMKSRDER